MIKKPAANAAPLFSALTVIAMFFLCRIAAAAVPGIDVNVMRPDFNTGEWTVAAPAATGTFDIARATQAASAATETAPDKAAPAQPVTTAPQPKVPMIEYEPGTAPPKAPPQAAASVEKKAQQKK